MCMEKKNAESQDRRNFESVRVLLVIFTRVTTLQSCYNFAGVLHFFLRIINSIKHRRVYFIFRDSKSQIQ